MPELPEMETYRHLLAPRLTGRVVQGITVTREKSINVPVAEMEHTLVGRNVKGVSRRAKHLLFYMEGDRVLLLHLMLGGWMFWGTPEQKPERTVQVELTFGRERLFFIGLRLGYLHLYETAAAENLLKKLGPEPLDSRFDGQTFISLIKGRKGALKPILTDQSVLSGIGSCYSDEICFVAGIRPDRKTASLESTEALRLYRSVKSVLNQAIAYGGYMDTPFFVGDTITGGYSSRCLVYDREGQLCVRCGNPIVRHDVVSKKSFFCTVCQR